MKRKLYTTLKDNTLTINKSKWHSYLTLGFLLLFFTIWYISLFNQVKSLDQLIPYIVSNVKKNTLILIFYLTPLFFLKLIISNIKVIVTGDYWIFNKHTQSVHSVKEKICDIFDINYIKIFTTNYDSEEHTLSLVLKSNIDISIDTSSNYECIVYIADDLADFLKVGIKNDR